MGGLRSLSYIIIISVSEEAVFSGNIGALGNSIVCELGYFLRGNVAILLSAIHNVCFYFNKLLLRRRR